MNKVPVKVAHSILTVHDLYFEVCELAQLYVQTAGALKYVIVYKYASNKLGQGGATSIFPRT